MLEGRRRVGEGSGKRGRGDGSAERVKSFCLPSPLSLLLFLELLSMKRVPARSRRKLGTRVGRDVERTMEREGRQMEGR